MVLKGWKLSIIMEFRWLLEEIITLNKAMRVASPCLNHGRFINDYADVDRYNYSLSLATRCSVLLQDSDRKNATARSWFNLRLWISKPVSQNKPLYKARLLQVSFFPHFFCIHLACKIFYVSVRHTIAIWYTQWKILLIKKLNYFIFLIFLLLLFLYRILYTFIGQWNNVFNS